MKSSFDCSTDFFPKLFFGNVRRRRRRSEKREPDLLNSCLQFAPRPGAFLDHTSSPFSVQSTEVRRQTRRHLRIRTIGNGQPFQQIIESEVLLFEERDMFFQWHRQILAGTLGKRLSVRPAHCFFPALHRRRAGRGDEHARYHAAYNRSVKTFIVSEIGQHRVSAASAHRKLDGTFA